mmetsp:Transcript_10544/g.14877  ORF Transcript_10544/g.14877 Transcript_10544/m.14877 type:complete len:82 (+) Transcript_10544:1597-1842(+)
MAFFQTIVMPQVNKESIPSITHPIKMLNNFRLSRERNFLLLLIDRHVNALSKFLRHEKGSDKKMRLPRRVADATNEIKRFV